MKKLSYMHTAFTWNCICTNNHNTFDLFPQSHCTRLGIKLSSTTLQLYRWCTKTLDTSALWGPVRYWRCPTSSIFSNKCLIVIEYHVEKLLFRVSNCSSVVIVCSQSKPSWVPTVRCSLFSCFFSLFWDIVHFYACWLRTPMCFHGAWNHEFVKLSIILWWLCMCLGAKCWALRARLPGCKMLWWQLSTTLM